LAEAIRIGDPAIEVRLRRHAGARRMVLRVSHLGSVPTLTLPPGVPLARARAFLADQETWIRGHLAAQGWVTPVRDGAVIPFRGEELAIRLVPGGRFRREDAALLVSPKGETGPSVAAWLREEARRDVVAASERHAARLGVRIGRITLRDPRSRWGSCTPSGDLMYSWRLVMAPPPVLDYVAAHEVAHIAELNHSAAFWAVVGRLMPGYDAPRDWLRRNGGGLHRIDFGIRPA
jgi:predicted metal-dependent hydrolase